MIYVMSDIHGYYDDKIIISGHTITALIDPNMKEYYIQSDGNK